MPRQVLQSNNSILAIHRWGSWRKPGYWPHLLMAGVTESSFSFEAFRAADGQIGSQNLGVNHTVRHPTVSFQVGYYLTSNFLNEKYLGMATDSADPRFTFSGFTGTNDFNNFIYMHHPDQGKDALEVYRLYGTQTKEDWSGFHNISIGNCFLNSYSLNFQVGSIPQVNLGFSAVNIEYEVMTGGKNFKSPEIILEDGNDVSANISAPNWSGTGLSGPHDRSSPYATVPGDVHVNISPSNAPNFKSLGTSNSSGDFNIESLGLELSLPREDSYRLGSDFVSDRSLQFPVRGTLSMSAVVSGFRNESISGTLDTEAEYDIDIGFLDHRQTHSGQFRISEAKLETYNYSMIATDLMRLDASYSFYAGRNFGLKTRSRPHIVTENLFSYYDIADLRSYTGAIVNIHPLEPSTGNSNTLVLLDDDSDGTNSYSGDYGGFINLQDQHLWHGGISYTTARYDKSATIVVRPWAFSGGHLFTILQNDQNPQFNCSLSAGGLTVQHFGFGGNATFFSHTFNTGQWYVISASDDATNGRVKVWVNGASIGDEAVAGTLYSSTADRIRVLAQKLGSFNREHPNADLIAFMYNPGIVYTDAQALQNYNAFKGRITTI